MRSPKITALVWILCLGGCTKNAPNDTSKGVNAQSSSVELTKENAGKIAPFEENVHFTAEELKAIAVARDHIELRDKNKIDARYSIERNATGWMVTVYYVGGYRDGRPNFAPGMSPGYQVSDKTWKVESIEPGL